MFVTLPKPDQEILRGAFARFPSGVAALTATVDGEQIGMVASSFSVGASFDPPMVMFAVKKSSNTWPILRRARRIGVSILGDAHDRICRQLASRSGDRFAGIDLRHGESGAILIVDAALWMECEIVSETPAGDHAIVVLEVKGVHFESHIEPLIFHGSTFRQLGASAH